MSDLKKLIEGLPIRIHEGRVASVCKMSFSAASVTERLPQLEYSPHYAINVEALGWRVILALMDEAEQKFEHEEDCPCYGDIVRHAEDCANCTCEKPGEQNPAWEPGTVLLVPRGLHFRLEKQFDDGTWKTTLIETGESVVAYFGDSSKVCLLTKEEADLFYVPPPKEVMPNETNTKARVGPKSAVTGAHRAVETSENPFQGPHWKVDLRSLSNPTQIMLILASRIQDVADELLRMRGA